MGGQREREAPKIDAFSMQNSRSTRLIVAGQHATRIPLWQPLTILSFPLCQASTYITTSVTYVLDRIESGIEAVNTLLTLTTLIHNNGAAGIEFMVY